MSCVLRYVSLIQLFLSLISCRHEKQFQKHHSKQVGKQKKEQPKLFQPDFQHMSGTKNTHIQGKAVGEQRPKKPRPFETQENTGSLWAIAGKCRLAALKRNEHGEQLTQRAAGETQEKQGDLVEHTVESGQSKQVEHRTGVEKQA